ncbi:MAG: PGPGW domain-containing protein [Candidatus Hydrogenedentes bacterium]|nr:PGPGW domain-containing protein [Candidatus Hydrogenedentota bacterium]
MTWIVAAACLAVLLAGAALWFSPSVRAAAGALITNLTIAQARRLIVLVVGGTVLLAGLAMLLLPGPGVVVTVAGLGVLGTEFLWARRLLRRVRETTGQVYNSITGATSAANVDPPSRPAETKHEEG